MKHDWWKRFLALLLAVQMAASSVSVHTFAMEAGEDSLLAEDMISASEMESTPNSDISNGLVHDPALLADSQDGMQDDKFDGLEDDEQIDHDLDDGRNEDEDENVEGLFETEEDIFESSETDDLIEKQEDQLIPEGAESLESIEWYEEEWETELEHFTAIEEEEMAEAEFNQSLTIDDVVITVRAEAGVFPAEAELSAEKVSRRLEAKADEAVEEAREDGTNAAVSYTFDIKILDADGNEIQPAEGAKVEVSFALAQVGDANLEASVYHITEEENGEELTAEKLDGEIDVMGESVTVETDGFSLYTVEFTYNDLQYVLDGDKDVSLSEILNTVGLTGEAEAVSVSDESLFSADCDELTGEWTVHSHRAFSTEEWMRVTILGIEYEITVTDAQYMPVDPAPAGRYAITLYPKGKGLADFYSLKMTVEDENGRTYFWDYYTVIDASVQSNEDPFDVLRTHTFDFEAVPVSITIRCGYKYNYPGYDYEELIYEGTFKEGVDQAAKAVSPVNEPGQEIWFCDYSVDYLEGPLRYIDENGNLQQADEWERFTAVMGVYGSSPDDEGPWYAVTGNLETSKVVLDGNANLVLCDGANLETSSFYVPEGTTLRIYGQKNGTGKLTAVGSTTAYVVGGAEETKQYGDAGIGGVWGVDGAACGTIIINGGIIDATGGPHAAGIGGAEGQNSGTVIINRGSVTARGGVKKKGTGISGAGIGGGAQNNGKGGDSGEIIINGGTVTAIGTKRAAGIGSGPSDFADSGGATCGPITINGGTVYASGVDGGAGIGGGRKGKNGPITITGGEVNAETLNDLNDSNATGTKAAAIGAGEFRAQDGPITISGGTVIAASYGYGAGIGGAAGDAGRGGCSGGTIHISGAKTEVVATSFDGAGIGSGGDEYGVNAGEGRPNGGNITIDDGFVFAVSGRSGAGIGGGNNGNGGNITINGGYVVACGGCSNMSWWYAAKDQPENNSENNSESSSYSASEYIVAEDSQILAASIWELPEPQGPSKVNKYMSSYANKILYDKIAELVLGLIFDGEFSGAGIGGGDDGASGTIRINGGVVEAKGGSSSCSAIGKGDGGSSSIDLSIYKYSKVTYGALKKKELYLQGQAYGTTAGAESASHYPYALIEPDELKVSFDMNGHGNPVETQTVLFGECAAKPTDPAADGWFFCGWYQDAALMTPFDFDAPITGPTTIYARWIKAYTITIKKEWPEGSVLPDSVYFSCRQTFAGRDLPVQTLYLTEENDWKDTLTVSSLSTLRISEQKLTGFLPDGWRFTSGAASGQVSGIVDQPGGGALIDMNEVLMEIRVKNYGEVSSDDILRSDPVLTFKNARTNIFSVEKKWNIDRAGAYKPDSIKAALQHKGSDGTWTTVQTRTLSDTNGWKADFYAASQNEDYKEDDYRIREMDEQDGIVLDASDEGESDGPKVTYKVQPYTNIPAQNIKYDVNYEKDPTGKTIITNSAGKAYSVRMEWGNTDKRFIPDSVEVCLEMNDGYGWYLEESLELSAEDEWEGSFSPQLKQSEYRIRVQEDRNKNDKTVAVFEVGCGNSVRKFEYDVTYENEDDCTTITSQISGVIYSARKRWENTSQDKADAIYSVYAVLQHKEDNEWVTVGEDPGASSIMGQRGAVSLSTNSGWKNEFEAVPFSLGKYPADADPLESIDNEYRVREIISNVMDYYGSGWVFDIGDRVDSVEIDGTEYHTMILLDENDEDYLPGEDYYALYRRRYNKYTETAEWGATFAASYSFDDGCFFITNTQQADFSVEKEWETIDGEPLSGTPDSIFAALQHKVGNQWICLEVIELNEGNGWKGYFSTSREEDDPLINYRVRELTADADQDMTPEETDRYIVYDQGDADRPSAAVVNRVTYTGELGELVYGVKYNTSYPHGFSVTEITNTWSHPPACKTVHGETTWIDYYNKNRTRPDHITIHLLDGDTVIDSQVVSPDENGKWQWTFTGLPRYRENGEEIPYAISEEEPENYTAVVNGYKVGENEISKYDVTNVLKEDGVPIVVPVPVYNADEDEDDSDDKISIKVRKIWDDDDNRDGKRPKSVKVYLLANGVRKAEVNLSADQNWEHTFEDLDEKLAAPDQGTPIPIIYTVAEERVDDYTAKVERDFSLTDLDDVENLLTLNTNYKITNTYEPETTDATVRKVWEDQQDRDEARPKSLKATLMAGDEAAEDIYGNSVTVTLSEDNDWTATAYDLPAFLGGERVSYTWMEEEVEGYTAKPASYNKQTRTTTLTNEKTRVYSVSVLWNVDENQMSRPGNIMAVLQKKTGDGADENWETVQTVTVYAGQGWKRDFAPVPDDGTVYRVRELDNNRLIVHDPDDPEAPEDEILAYFGFEDPGTAYLVGYDEKDTVTTITNTVVSVSPDPAERTEQIGGTIFWEDDDENAFKRPEEVVIHIGYYDEDGTKNEVAGSPVTVKESKDWDWNLSLDVSDPAFGKTLFVEEDVPDGYYARYDGFDIYNILLTDVSVKAVWDDQDDRDGIRPDSLAVTLYAGGTKARDIRNNPITVTLSASNNWTYTVKDLPKYELYSAILYTWKAEDVDGYRPADPVTNGRTTTLTHIHIPEERNLIVRKVWKNDGNAQNSRPGSLMVELYANGEQALDGLGQAVSVTLKPDNNWRAAAKGLPKYQGGKEITYHWIEKMPEGYAGYSLTETRVEEDVTTLVNTYEAQSVSLKVKKVWDDQDNQDGMRPDEVIVSLYRIRDSVKEQPAVEVYTLNEACSWEATYDKLPAAYSDGTKIEYVWEEQSVPNGYTNSSTVHGTVTTLTGSHQVLTENVRVRNVWMDENDQDGIRPERLTVTVSDGSRDVATLELNAKNNWTGTVFNLPSYRNGTPVTYSWSEIVPEGYSLTKTEGNNTYTTLYNSHAPEKIQISVGKKWEDGNDQDKIRPDSVTVRLLADEEETGRTLILSDSNGWKGSFDGLFKKKNGRNVVYTVVEQKTDVITDLDGELTYEAKEPAGSAETGFMITNTHTPYALPQEERIDLEGSVIWDDQDDQDGMRPDSVRIMLLADGEEAAQLTVSEAAGWKWTFANQPKKKGDKEIAYSVKADEVSDYTAEHDGLNVTYAHIPLKTSVYGKAVWDDDNDRDRKRPGSITIRLLANGERVTGMEKTVTKDDGWTWIFDNLPCYQNGRPVNYAFEEEPVAGYETRVQGSNVINTHEPETVGLAGSISWADSSNQDGIRPAYVMIRVLSDGEQAGSLYVTKADDQSFEDHDWSFDIKGLPKYKGGNEISYTIDEDPVDGYAKEITGCNIKNTHIPATVTIQGEKTWEDDDNRDGKRPAGITIRLKADGREVRSVTVTAAENWQWTFADLPAYETGDEIAYSVTEDSVEGYTSRVRGYDVTNTYTPEKTQVAVSIFWDDEDDQDGLRPKYAAVRLLADGEDTGKTLDLSGDSTWTGSFPDLAAYKDGNKITYTIQEVMTDVITGEDGAGTYASITSGNMTQGFTVTNNHTPATVNIEGAKTWEDGSNNDGMRPESITIRLKADGQQAASKIVTSNDGWAWVFADVPKYHEGREIEYTITEDAVENYISETDGYNVTNRHAPGKTQVSVTKIWDDDDDRDGIRPVSVRVKLLADGSDVKDSSGQPLTLTLSEENDWADTFTDLAAYSRGEKITYTVEEVKTGVITGKDGKGTYDSVVTGNAGRGFTVINTHTPETVRISGRKVWDDQYILNGVRPESITVSLKADNREVDFKEVTINDNWMWSFANLPKYSDGREIEYTVTEDAPGHYTFETDGFNLINHYTPDKTQVSVAAVWDDSYDQDGIRPETITVALLANQGPAEDADGQPLTITLSEKNDWSGSFTNLNVSNEGTRIVYTVEEVMTDVITGEDKAGTYASLTSGDMTKGFTFTNIHTPETIDIKGAKTWEDGSDNDGMRPDTISIHLLANGKETASAVVSEAEEWKWVFSAQPKCEAGKAVVYSVREDRVSGYTPAYDGVNVTNTHSLLKTDRYVRIIWDDSDNNDGKRPESVAIYLLADGERVDEAIVTEADRWTWRFKNLPVYKSGEKIRYTITEDVIEGYTASISGSDVINTLTPAQEDPSSEGEHKTGDSSGEEQNGKAQNKDNPAEGDGKISSPGLNMGEGGTGFGKGADEEALDQAIAGMRSDDDPKGTAYGLLRLRSKKVKQTSIQVVWQKLSDAKKYVVYANVSGNKNKLMKVKTTTARSFTLKKLKGKKLKKGTYYKFMVAALDENNKVITVSTIIHVATKGGKVGNYKSLSVTSKAGKRLNRVTLGTGKTLKVKTKQVPASSSLKVKGLRGVRFESSNPGVARITASGVIKGVGKGTCSVFAYTQNGLYKKIRVKIR